MKRKLENYLNQKDFVPTVKPSKPKLQIAKTFPKDWLNRLNEDHSYWRQRGISTTTVEKFRGGVANRGSFTEGMFSQYLRKIP